MGFPLTANTVSSTYLLNNFNFCVSCRTCFRTIGTNPYTFLHFLVHCVSDNLAFCMKQVSSRFALDFFPSQSHESVTIKAHSLQVMSFILPSLILFLQRVFKGFQPQILPKLPPAMHPLLNRPTECTTIYFT